jgi:hypothetical protein
MWKLTRKPRPAVSLCHAAALLSILGSLAACASLDPSRRGMSTGPTAGSARVMQPSQPTFWGYSAERTALPAGPTFWGYSAQRVAQPSGPTFWGYSPSPDPIVLPRHEAQAPIAARP